MSTPDHNAPPPELRRGSGAFRGFLYALAAELILGAVGIFLGCLAWLLDWSIL